MSSLKQFELQQQIKENARGLEFTINELHKWEKGIKRTAAANCQTKKNEVSSVAIVIVKLTLLLAYSHKLYLISRLIVPSFISVASKWVV